VIGTAQADLNSFQSALEQYRNIGGHYPSQEQGLQVLLQRPVNPPLPEDWVQTVDDDDAFLDPWRTPYRYRYDGTDELEKPEIISAGPDKAFGTEDDLSSQTE
jgi:general secretion pathway protein G